MSLPLTITDATSAATLRADLLTAIFGGSLPTTLPTATAVASPVPGLPACERLDLAGYASSWLWVPSGATQLVVVHQGHLATLTATPDTLVADMIRDFHRAGYAVLGCVMPGGGSTANHDLGTTPISAFLLPVIAGINYVGATSVWMTGISGGGWTTVLAAAVDWRITASAPVCGSLPWYMSPTGRDWEQNIPARLGIDYLDMYVLGGSNGRQLQLNADDDAVTSFRLSTFRNADDYRAAVADLVASLGGSWAMRWVNQTQHQYTTFMRREVYEFLSGRPFPYSQVRDNTQATFVGTWGTFTSGYSGNHRAHAASTSDKLARFAFTVAPGTYDIAATWPPNTNRGTDVPFRVYDGTTLLDTVRINQETAPADFTADGFGWRNIGRFTVTSDLFVDICADANEYAVADAVRVLGVP